MSDLGPPPDSRLRAAIAGNSTLRNRVRAIVLTDRWLNQPDLDGPGLIAEVDTDNLAVAVAANVTIFAAIKTVVTGQDALNVETAIETGCNDNDLTYALLATDGTGAVARLADQSPT